MPQADCVQFLRWAMPRLGLRWSGFRRCHRQVCRRLQRRLVELGLAGFGAYRDYLLRHDGEWRVVDACCRVTISRFYRDRKVFDRLTDEVLPALAAAAEARGAATLRAWSAGCGAGEEPYSLTLAWRFGAALRWPRLCLQVVATDIDEWQLGRARTGCYQPAALRDLPAEWRETAFVPSGSLCCLRPEVRGGVTFLRQDIRDEAPKGPFDLILCRNLAFTYFEESRQRAVLARILGELAPAGFLVVGRRERLPTAVEGVAAWAPDLGIFSRIVC